jgi:hypothetical protein
MSTLLETTGTVQKQVLDALKSGEDAVLSAVKQVTDAVEPVLEPVTSRVSQAPFAEQLPPAKDVVDQWFSFAEKVLANQKQFTLKLVDLFAPAAPPAKPAAKTTKSTESKVA